MTREIKIINSGHEQSFESSHNFVIVGANGSGKSHLGAAIEKQDPTKVFRISAQRALSIPDHISITDYKSTWNKLNFGDAEKQNKGYKWGHDGKEYTTKLIDDYSVTMSSVFSFQAQEDFDYGNYCNDIIKREGCVKKPLVRITDRIRQIWSTVFPQRELIFKSAEVDTSFNGTEYQAKYMSDGERVALYLISQCLLAPDDMTIVIDEPEIHLHRTIMAKLWDAIEQYCQNKSFVYITHDLDFAVSRKEAKMIWVRSFNGKDGWELEELPDSDEIPEGLMIEVLGNRKPVLFIEGNKASYDFQLYSQVFEERYVIPAHNCLKVIELTKAFNNEDIKRIHHLEVKGLIDRDYLSDEEIDAYKKEGICTLSVAEVENLFLLEPVVKIVAEQLVRDPEETFEKVRTFVFAEFEKEKEDHLKKLCARHISYKLQQYNIPKGNGVQDLKESIGATVGAIDIDGIYSKNRDRIEKIIREKDYNGLLFIYNSKSMPKRVSGIFGLSNNGYPNMVLNLFKSDKRDELLKAFTSLREMLI